MARCGYCVRTSVLAIFITVAVLSAPSAAFAERRVALVIGNGAYKHATHLPNPTNDARDVAAALGRIGFDTILGLDLDRAGMDDYAVRFARARVKRMSPCSTTAATPCSSPASTT
jgi:Caspase domain